MKACSIIVRLVWSQYEAYSVIVRLVSQYGSLFSHSETSISRWKSEININMKAYFSNSEFHYQVTLCSLEYEGHRSMVSCSKVQVCLNLVDYFRWKYMQHCISVDKYFYGYGMCTYFLNLVKSEVKGSYWP